MCQGACPLHICCVFGLGFHARRRRARCHALGTHREPSMVSLSPERRPRLQVVHHNAQASTPPGDGHSPPPQIQSAHPVPARRTVQHFQLEQRPALLALHDNLGQAFSVMGRGNVRGNPAHPRPSLKSRTYPTKLTTAPTPTLAACIALTSVPGSNAVDLHSNGHVQPP